MEAIDKAADPCDHASNMQAIAEQAQLKHIRAEAAKPIPTSDVCLLSSCEAPTVGGARWCDGFCRDRWQQEQVGKR